MYMFLFIVGIISSIIGLLSLFYLVDSLAKGDSQKGVITSIFMLVSGISGIILLIHVVNMEEKEPTIWKAVRVENLSKKESDLTSQEIQINHQEEKPYIVYEDIKNPKLVYEGEFYKNASVITTTALAKKIMGEKSLDTRLGIVLPKNYDKGKLLEDKTPEDLNKSGE
ncbi:TPA: hypothetical protein H1592_002870 [Listeria monocytogenes]|nr:hypothetical protein [Listeria monocytogenes]